MARPRERAFITGNRWEAAVSASRTLADINDRKLKKLSVVKFMTLEDVREMKELMDELEKMMEDAG